MRISVSDLVEITASQRKTTAAGYLIVPGNLARAGNVQEYRRRELGLDGGDKIIRLHRPAAEVFQADAMASFEGAPLTVGHPPGSVNAQNWRAYAVGEVRDVKRVGDFMVGTLTVRDAEAVREIIAGRSQLSCGYECDVDMTPGPTHDGVMRDIRGNHCAVVEVARGGPELRLADAGSSELEPAPLYPHLQDSLWKPSAEEIQQRSRLYGGALLTYRMNHGGKLPPAQAAEVEARQAALAEGRGLYGGALMIHRINTGYYLKKENQR